MKRVGAESKIFKQICDDFKEAQTRVSEGTKEELENIEVQNSTMKNLLESRAVKNGISSEFGMVEAP